VAPFWRARDAHGRDVSDELLRSGPSADDPRSVRRRGADPPQRRTRRAAMDVGGAARCCDPWTGRARAGPVVPPLRTARRPRAFLTPPQVRTWPPRSTSVSACRTPGSAAPSSGYVTPHAERSCSPQTGSCTGRCQRRAPHAPSPRSPASASLRHCGDFEEGAMRTSTSVAPSTSM
jgi:hypothetical protein